MTFCPLCRFQERTPSGIWRLPRRIGSSRTYRIRMEVALIDPVSSSEPIFEATLAGAGLSGPGDNPAHIYRDPTDPEVMWSMNDGDANGDDGINCPTPQTGGSVTILHNSHIGPGGTIPEIHREDLFRAWRARASLCRIHPRAGLPVSTYITSGHDGAVIVIDNNPNNIGTYLSVIDRLDMCDGTKEACDTDVGDGEHGGYPCDLLFHQIPRRCMSKMEAMNSWRLLTRQNGNAVDSIRYRRIRTGCDSPAMEDSWS